MKALQVRASDKETAEMIAYVQTLTNATHDADKCEKYAEIPWLADVRRVVLEIRSGLWNESLQRIAVRSIGITWEGDTSIVKSSTIRSRFDDIASAIRAAFPEELVHESLPSLLIEKTSPPPPELSNGARVKTPAVEMPDLPASEDGATVTSVVSDAVNRIDKYVREMTADALRKIVTHIPGAGMDEINRFVVRWWNELSSGDQASRLGADPTLAFVYNAISLAPSQISPKATFSASPVALGQVPLQQLVNLMTCLTNVRTCLVLLIGSGSDLNWQLRVQKAREACPRVSHMYTVDFYAGDALFEGVAARELHRMRPFDENTKIRAIIITSTPITPKKMLH